MRIHRRLQQQQRQGRKGQSATEEGDAVSSSLSLALYLKSSFFRSLLVGVVSHTRRGRVV